MSKGPVSLPSSLKRRIGPTAEKAQPNKPLPSLEDIRKTFAPEGAGEKLSPKGRTGATGKSVRGKSDMTIAISFRVSGDDYELLREIGGHYGSPNRTARIMMARALAAERKKRE